MLVHKIHMYPYKIQRVVVMWHCVLTLILFLTSFNQHSILKLSVPLRAHLVCYF